VSLASRFLPAFRNRHDQELRCRSSGRVGRRLVSEQQSRGSHFSSRDTCEERWSMAKDPIQIPEPDVVRPPTPSEASAAGSCLVRARAPRQEECWPPRQAQAFLYRAGQRSNPFGLHQPRPRQSSISGYDVVWPTSRGAIGGRRGVSVAKAHVYIQNSAAPSLFRRGWRRSKTPAPRSRPWAERAPSGDCGMRVS
jgi:hypothetical protein